MELKHIAPYLPYGLKGNLVNLEYFDSQICCELYRIETGKTKESDKYDITVIVGDCESELKDFICSCSSIIESFVFCDTSQEINTPALLTLSEYL